MPNAGWAETEGGRCSCVGEMWATFVTSVPDQVPLLPHLPHPRQNEWCSSDEEIKYPLSSCIPISIALFPQWRIIQHYHTEHITRKEDEFCAQSRRGWSLGLGGLTRGSRVMSLHLPSSSELIIVWILRGFAIVFNQCTRSIETQTKNQKSMFSGEVTFSGQNLSYCLWFCHCRNRTNTNMFDKCLKKWMWRT